MPKRGLANPGRVSAVARRYAKRNPPGLSRNCQRMRCFGRRVLALASPEAVCRRADCALGRIGKRRGRMYRGSCSIQPEAARFRRRLWLLVMLSAQAAAPGSAPATTIAEGEWRRSGECLSAFVSGARLEPCNHGIGPSVRAAGRRSRHGLNNYDVELNLFRGEGIMRWRDDERR
jgi:hypothetical protein